MYTITFYTDDTTRIAAKYIQEVGNYTYFEDFNGVPVLMVKTCDVKRVTRD